MPGARAGAALMLKQQALTAALARAVPDFSNAPDRFQAYVSKGRAIARATPGAGFEYRYTLEIFLLDYAGHPDAVFWPLIQWMLVNQPEQFQNDQLREDAIRFDVDILTEKRFNISIEVQLSESVVAASDGKGGTTLTHLDEPGDLGDPMSAPDGSDILLRQIWAEVPPGAPDQLVP